MLWLVCLAVITVLIQGSVCVRFEKKQSTLPCHSCNFSSENKLSSHQPSCPNLFPLLRWSFLKIFYLGFGGPNCKFHLKTPLTAPWSEVGALLALHRTEQYSLAHHSLAHWIACFDSLLSRRQNGVDVECNSSDGCHWVRLIGLSP